MLNIRELERRWFRYKLKSYIPHIATLISLSLVLLFVLFFSSKKELPVVSKIVTTTVPAPKPPVVVKKETKPQIKTPVISISEPVEKEVKPTPQSSVVESKKIKLAPSLDFMKKMNNSANPYYNGDITPSNYSSNEVKNTPTPPKKTVVEKKPKIVDEESSQQKINIKRQNTQNDIYDIIKRFKKNNNPALSLFVAKKYYELQNYRQAYNYALITNKINKEIESSWIIFAKSLVKLGKKEKAVKMLKKYVKQTNSNQADILLDEIQSGKFK